ncbi:MAG: hypothetical protein ACLSTJ_07905 [Clostridium neonatale]
MVKKLSKSEFMALVINDYYNKRFKKKQQLQAAEIHSIENTNKVQDFRRKKK